MAKRVSKKAGEIAVQDVPSTPNPSPLAEYVPAYIPLDSIIGQKAAIASLRAAMRTGRLHHAWIFHGSAGVGKLTSALAFAGMILDPTTEPDLAGNLTPDPQSTVQNLLRSSSHPDLHVIRKELAGVSREKSVRDSKQTGIAKEVIEEFLLEPASKTRVMGGGGVGGSMVGKVFVIDEAELLSVQTQNVLLKTLEEPPLGTIIILVTSQEDRLLATIRSRSQRLAFSPLSDAEMSEWLKRSGLEIDAQQRSWIAEHAAGSPGQALSAVQNDLYRWHTTLEPLLNALDAGRFDPAFGATASELVEERAKAAVQANPDASKDAANKVWGRRMLGFLAERYRRKLRDIRSGGLQPLAALDSIAEAERQIAANVNLKFVLENLAAMIASPSVEAMAGV